MGNYISIIRGINVGGHNKVSMALLKQMYIDLGFSDAQTFIQSGNVIFSSPNPDVRQIARMISEKIKVCFGIDVTVFVLTGDELRDAVDNNPFAADSGKDPAFFHITIFSGEPDVLKMEEIYRNDNSPDEWRNNGRFLYLYCPQGYGRTKLTNTFFERKLKLAATTRNWNTIQRILEMTRND